MNKFKVSVFMSLFIVLLLGACKGNDLENYENELNKEVSNPILEEDIELVLRHTYAPEPFDQIRNQRLGAMIDIIEEENDVKVTLDEGTEDSYADILSDEATRNELPHIIEVDINSYGHGSFFYEDTEHFLDLTDFLEESGLIDQFHSLDHFTVDGRVYGIPLFGEINQLFYKKDLVEELGGVPETWNDLIEIMGGAKRAGYTPIYLDDFTALPFTLFEGVLQQTVSSEKLFELLNGEAKWTDEEFVATFETIETLKELDISTIDGDPIELHQAFFTDDIVFAYTIDAFIQGMASSSDDFSHMQGNIGVMSMPPVPGAQGEPSSVHGSFTSGYVSRANVTEEEEQMIYQFIETLLSEELMVEEHVQYVSLPSIRVEADATNDELLQEIIHTTNEADGVFLGIKEFIPPATKNSYDPFLYESEVNRMLNDFIFEDHSTQETLEAMQNYHEVVLQEANLNE